jgi:hypothetical protein
METLSLNAFIEEAKSQPLAAKMLGCHQTALSAAIRKNRQIFIQRAKGQIIGAYEVKPALNLPFVDKQKTPSVA